MGDSSSTVKKISIRGSAIQDLKDSQMGGKRRAVRRTTAKIRKQQGGDIVPGESLAAAANYNAASKITQTLKGGAAPLDTLSGHQPQIPAVLKTPAVEAALSAGTAPRVAAAPAQVGAGPAAKAKLQLLPPKQKKKKSLVLAPPATQHGKRTAAPPQKTRKIRVQLAGLKKRLTKAKAISKDSRDKSIGEIRKVLEEANLVKPAKEGKVVPESVLRDIYKDYLLLRNRAL